MINAARALPFSPPEADDFEVEMIIRSWKHDCHTAYRLNKHEIENLSIPEMRRRKMPLIQGKKAKTKKGFSTNVKREMEAGKPQKQAVAIAYSEAREGKKRRKK